MKFLFFFACAIAAALADHLVAPVEPFYPGPQHLPVIGPNGVPVDTPAVQHATAAHLTHKVEAHARNGDYHHHGHHHVAGPVVATPVAPAYTPAATFVNPEAYPTSFGVPAVTGHGVPLETPEVVAAKTAHFAAHGEALARTGHAAGYHYIAKRQVYSPYAYTTPGFYYGTYGHHFLAKRQIYTPTVYTTPYTHGYGHYGYGAYGHHFLAKRQIYTPSVYSPHYYGHATYPYAHYY